MSKVKLSGEVFKVSGEVLFIVRWIQIMHKKQTESVVCLQFVEV